MEVHVQKTSFKMIFCSILLSDLIASIFDNGLFECAIETAKPFNAFIVELLMLLSIRKLIFILFDNCMNVALG